MMLRVALAILIAAFSATVLPVSGWNLTEAQEKEFNTSLLLFDSEFDNCVKTKCGDDDDDDNDDTEATVKPTNPLERHITELCKKECYAESVKPVLDTIRRIFKAAAEDRWRQIEKHVRSIENIEESEKQIQAILAAPILE